MRRDDGNQGGTDVGRVTLNGNVFQARSRGVEPSSSGFISPPLFSRTANWLPTGETTAKGSPRGAQSREMGPSLGGPGEKSEKPRRKPVAVRDE